MTGPATPQASARVRVKICGITRPEDAAAAERAGADVIGMIFARSKRQVDMQAAADIIGAVGPFITTVGVFRDAPLEAVIETLERLNLDVAQLHGDESAEYAATVRRHADVMRAVSYGTAPEPSSLKAYPADAYLIDGPKPGSGERYDWREILAWRGHPRLVLAGGLQPDNVAEAVRLLRPYAVDVASGVERSVGVKDLDSMLRFVEQVRLADPALTLSEAAS